ncbi:hypothetical protein MPSEU_000714100 [Mayamaea pseudoterrestris]|nr:hypothetical protein MPSEU_000714100 [Mayamaea pseudoterrestris]
MSRPAPSYISKDDMHTLNDVRKDLWKNGLYGLGMGSLAGLSLHSVASLVQKRSNYKLFQANRNTAFMSVMLGGAIGSFVLSTTAGKNDVHQLHKIFESGSRDARQERLMEEEDLNASLRHHQSQEGQRNDVLTDRMQREKNRLTRRASLEHSLNSRNGLSDSHGGKWADDDRN